MFELFSLSFTIYCLSGVVFSGLLCYKLIKENIFPKVWYKWMLIFLPFTLVTFVVGWISYSYHHYNKNKKGV